MNQNENTKNASRTFSSGESILRTDPFPKPRTEPFPFRILKRSALVLVVICLIIGGYITAVAKSDSYLDFEITGYLRHTEFGIDGKERKKEKHLFKLWMKDDFWLIQMTPSQESVEGSLASSVELGTDGEKTYRLLSYNTNFDSSLPIRQALADLDTYQAIARSLNEEQLETLRAQRDVLLKHLKSVKVGVDAKSLNKAVGFVFPFKFPNYYPEDYSSLVWFVYCSHGIQTNEERVKTPLFFHSGNPNLQAKDKLTQAAIVWTKTSPRLPEIATFQHEGYRWTHSPTGYVAETLPSPWNNGYTNAIYNVLSFTNSVGVSFPSRFSFKAYRIWNDLNGAVSLTPFDSYEGFTESIKTPCSISEFVPLIPTETLIENEDKVHYLAKPGTWLRTTNVALLKEHQRQILGAITTEKPRPAFVYFVFFLMVSWPLFLLLRKRLGTKR